MAFHYDPAGPMRLGYLAVDLFFLLSGFVVAGAYESRLRAGGRLGWFFGVRMARLYPLHLLGLSLGAAVLLSSGAAPGMVAPSFVLSAFFLPGPIHSADLFPLNGPAWSLALEVAINLIYAAAGYRLSTRALAGLVAGMAMGLIVAILLAHGAQGGAELNAFWMGPLRVGFSFPAGVLIWRLHHDGRLPRFRVQAGLLLALVLASFTFPSLNGTSDIFAVLLLYPAIVVLGINAIAPAGAAARAYAFAGRASYACYALHMPLGSLFALVAGAWGLPAGAGLVPTLVLVIAAALWFEPWGKRVIERIVGAQSLTLDRRTPYGRL